jgi:sentrin-specific protease 1
MAAASARYLAESIHGVGGTRRAIGSETDEECSRAKAKDDAYKEITKELERLTVEENKIREEALAKARARALKKKVELPALTDEQLAEVTAQLKNPRFQSKCDREEVGPKELQLLGPKQWLNDEVINFYGAMLMERAAKEGKRKVHFFNSFFFTKMAKDGYEKSRIGRWTKKVGKTALGVDVTNPSQIDIFSKDIVIFPINQNNMHWVCGAINMKDKRFEYYDSLSSAPDTHAFEVSTLQPCRSRC